MFVNKGLAGIDGMKGDKGVMGICRESEKGDKGEMGPKGDSCNYLPVIRPNDTYVCLPGDKGAEGPKVLVFSL